MVAVTTICAPRTASRADAAAATGSSSSRASPAATVQVPGWRQAIATSVRGRTAAIARTCARPWTPQPTTARREASRGARWSAATALAADVRSVVTASPSMIATGRPSTGSWTVTSAATVGRPRAALPGLTLPNLATAPAPGRRET